MGGTSFDVGLIVDGKPLVSGTHEAGGYHLNTPMIDIRAIGAGGGSIATVESGLLRVGPESAGARARPGLLRQRRHARHRHRRRRGARHHLAGQFPRRADERQPRRGGRGDP